MSENKTFTLKLDIKVSSDLSAIIFDAIQRSLVFRNCRAFPLRHPSFLRQTRVPIWPQITASSSKFRLREWVWFKCAPHHFGARRNSYTQYKLPIKISYNTNIWINNCKSLAWEKSSLHGRVSLHPKLQPWRLSKESSIFLAVYLSVHFFVLSAVGKSKHAIFLIHWNSNGFKYDI